MAQMPGYGPGALPIRMIKAFRLIQHLDRHP